MSIKWEGMDELRDILDDAGDQAPRLLGTALFREGEVIMGESKRIVPVDTGRLRSSGHVKPPRTTKTAASVELAYATDYAVYVHEGTRRMKGRKYLEGPVKAAASQFGSRLASRIKRLFQ